MEQELELKILKVIFYIIIYGLFIISIFLFIAISNKSVEEDKYLINDNTINLIK